MLVHDDALPMVVNPAANCVVISALIHGILEGQGLHSRMTASERSGEVRVRANFQGLTCTLLGLNDYPCATVTIACVLAMQ